MRTALDHKAAKRRVRRFFEQPAEERRHVSLLMDRLSIAAEVYVFGGAVRDISLLGGSSFDGDIDLVVRIVDQNIFDNILENCNAERNKFGGYRMQIGRWKFDIWEAAQTWAYKVGVVEDETHLSLLETTFFNWDAILFSARTGSLHHRPNYFEHLSNKYLELNLENNPNLTGAFIRTLRTLRLSDEICTGPKLSKFLKKKLSEMTDAEVLSYEENSFAKRRLSLSFLSDIRTKSDAWSGEDHYRWLPRQQACLFDN